MILLFTIERTADGLAEEETEALDLDLDRAAVRALLVALVRDRLSKLEKR